MPFSKYLKRGAYHWRQIGFHPVKSNAFVKARYGICVTKALHHFADSNYVLDLGCGDGVLTWLLANSGFRVTGIDLSDEAIQLATFQHQKRNSKAKLIVGNSKKLPDKAFDGIVASDVIEHTDSPSDFIDEILRLLKPGGKCIITTPLRYTCSPLDPEHTFEWFYEEFNDFLGSYNVIEVGQTHPVAYKELMNILPFRILINLLANLGFNMFYIKSNKLVNSLQYAVIVK